MSKRQNLDLLAKKQAITDIKQELREEKKAFLFFNKELDPVMKELVDNYQQGRR